MLHYKNQASGSNRHFVIGINIGDTDFSDRPQKPWSEHPLPSCIVLWSRKLSHVTLLYFPYSLVLAFYFWRLQLRFKKHNITVYLWRFVSVLNFCSPPNLFSNFRNNPRSTGKLELPFYWRKLGDANIRADPQNYVKPALTSCTKHSLHKMTEWAGDSSATFNFRKVR